MFPPFLPPLSLSTFTCNFILPSSLILLSHPTLAPLGWALGGDKFGGGQAEGGQTKSLCVRIVEQETGCGGGGVAGR